METVLAVEIMLESHSSLVEKDNPSILEDDFSSRTDPSIYTSMAPVLLDWSSKNSWVFLAVKSTDHFVSQSTLIRKSELDQIQVQ